MARFKDRSRALLVFASMTIFAACGSLPAVSTDISYCCRPGAEGVDTYRVEFEDTPEFLKPMLRDEASIVLAQKGLQYTEGDADAVLKMTFVNKTLEQDEEDLEGWQRSAPGGGVRFIALVEMEMNNAVTGERIWSGSMQRVHSVYEGSYMHDAPARAAMRDAFRRIFADYPNPELEM